MIKAAECAQRVMCLKVTYVTVKELQIDTEARNQSPRMHNVLLDQRRQDQFGIPNTFN